MVINLIFPHAATTRGITVRVAPRFLAHQSDPQQSRYVWSYHVRLENATPEAVQLVSRHWIVTDGDGRVEHIDGAGVIGQQPVIEPGAAFDYMSGCPLMTPKGSMHGHYHMVGESGGFDARIPGFALELPTASAGR